VDDGIEGEALRALRDELEGPSVASFAAHVAGLPAPPRLVADYYLAFAALAGAKTAVERVRELVAREAGAVVGRARRQPADANDLAQTLSAKLLVAPSAGGLPGLASYTGTGPLAAWIRVVAARAWVSGSRKRTEILSGPEHQGTLLRASGGGADPEAEYLRTKYQGVFEVAFREAASRLTVEERNLLRYHYVDGFSIDRLGAMYGIHRASVARRIHRAREALLVATREILRGHTFGSDSEMESVLRAVESRIELSVASLFRDPPRV